MQSFVNRHRAGTRNDTDQDGEPKPSQEKNITTSSDYHEGQGNQQKLNNITSNSMSQQQDERSLKEQPRTPKNQDRHQQQN